MSEPPPLRHDPQARLRATRRPLLEQLQATGRDRRPRRLAAAIAAVALGAAGWAVVSPSPQPALAVRLTAEVLELRITDPSASGEAMTADLREAGLRGAVVLVPAKPHEVGRWLVWAETASLRPRSACLDPDERAPAVTRLSTVAVDGAVLRVPARAARESTGAFVFVAGRAPREGEAVFTGPGLPVDHLPPDVRELVATPEPGARCP